MAKQNKFGTFGGVFVPSILTILGVIMYLRLPMIIGEAGLWATIGIIFVAHIISITTGLSVSSIATDKKVEAGGTYFMISRSLGLPIGGTLGLALFVGLSFSVSLYLIGFSESFLSYWGFENTINNIRLTGTIVLLAVTTVTFISTSLAIKTQYLIMAAIVLSLVSILFGNHDYEPITPLLSNPASAVPLMVLFGIYFPAVTGFEAGVSMSGDLKDPKTSIPLGSISAIAVGFVVYIGLAFFFAFTVSGEALANDSQILLHISWVPQLVIAGIWGATLSSALGSILGAPRILQATAVDKITPSVFGKGFGAGNEPRNALLLTFFIAECGILIGELDVIARIVSIFFITTYGFLNLSASFERWTSTDFRPDFKIPGWVSLVGAIACFLVMIQLDFLAMIGATFILGLLYLYLKRKELRLESGDAWSSVWASLVKTGLTNLKRDKLHNRNWRPNTIMFTGNPDSRSYMVEIGKAFSGKLGILSSFELVKSDNKILTKSESSLTEEKDTTGYFNHVLPCHDVYEGIDEIVRVYGFSGVEPNTILMGWSKNSDHKERFIKLLESFDKNHFNSIFLNYDHEKKFGTYQTIDIWWNGSGRNLSLAVNLVRNLSSSFLWKRASVRVLVINDVNDEQETIYNAISAILDTMRMDVKIKVINNEISPDSEADILKRESGDTDLTIMGIPDQKYQHLGKYYDQIDAAVNSINTSLIINASGDFEDFEVIADNESKSRQVSVSKESLQLQPLILSKHPEIAVDIRKIDNNGNRELDILYKKTFEEVINHRIDVLADLDKLVSFIKKHLSEIDELPDFYRKGKQIGSLKNDVFFKLNGILNDKMKAANLPEETADFENALNWYEDRLVEDYKKYPSRLKVSFSRAEFATKASDRSALKMYKRRKLFTHWITGGAITNVVNYREVARYYQLNTRRTFLFKLLRRFGVEEGIFYDDFRKITNRINQALEQFERKILLETEDWQAAADIAKIKLGVDDEISNQQKLLFVYQGRLILEFRRNLQTMNNRLEEIDVNREIRQKHRPSKYYKGIVAKTKDFPKERELQIMTRLNMILMEVSVNSTKNRIEELQEEFREQLTQGITKNYLRPLDEIEQAINSKSPEAIDKIKINDSFKLELQESFGENIQKITELSESMPESLEVYSFRQNKDESQETTAIPIARMAEYYLTSQYEVIIDDQFNKLMELLSRSIYATKDLLNLSQFSFDNKEVNAKGKKDILLELTQKLKKEREEITQAMESFVQLDQEQLDIAFEPLSSLKIEESASEFVSGLRSYQGKKVLTGLSKFSAKTKEVARDFATKLFYSRSEGILLAKNLRTTKELSSSTSQLLELKEHVSPKTKVIKSLPPYYVTLFMGKSNIGKDFWIKRSAEEATFRTAMDRHKQGFGGGILVLGERNSGKTALSKEIFQNIKTTTYSVFPPTQGNASVEAFNQALTKATQFSGDSEQILTRLPLGSVLIINDLELFWERNTEGLAVIHHLEKLMDTFGQRLLFVVNMNPHSYRLINQLTTLGDQFIEIINLLAFDAKELKDLIMKRHRSSGLPIGYKVDTDSLSEVQQAQLFNKYFNYSEGNPGTALNGWLANIVKHSSEGLIISKPSSPSLGSIKELNEDWSMLLAQFVLHKRLTVAKISRICEWEKAEIRSLLFAMLRAGIVQEKAAGVYHINPFVHPFVVKSLKEKEVLR